MVLLFWLAFTVTVALLGCALVTGRRGRRRPHYWSVAGFVVALAVTIFLTESIVRALEFPRDALDFHLRFAMGATYLLLPVLATGALMAWKGGMRIRWAHRITVVVFVLAVLAATGTGIWIFTLAKTPV